MRTGFILLFMILAAATAGSNGGIRTSLRLIRSASASLPVTVLDGLEKCFGVPVIETYGMTEAASQVASNPLPPGRSKPGSVGIAAGPEIAIIDEDEKRLPPGRTGEIALRGVNMFGGYERNEQEREAAFTRDGWFRSGDVGYLDDEGYLFITDRIKELINRGGQTVSPTEVEVSLLEHPSVAEAAAFAASHPTLGETWRQRWC